MLVMDFCSTSRLLRKICAHSFSSAAISIKRKSKHSYLNFYQFKKVTTKDVKKLSCDFFRSGFGFLIRVAWNSRLTDNHYVANSLDKLVRHNNSLGTAQKLNKK